MPIERSNSNLDSPNINPPRSENFDPDAIDKSRGIKGKLKGAAHSIRDHIRPTSREEGEGKSIKKALKSLPGKIKAGASKIKQKVHDLIKKPTHQPVYHMIIQPHVDPEEISQREKVLNQAIPSLKTEDWHNSHREIINFLESYSSDKLKAPVWNKLEEMAGQVPPNAESQRAMRTLCNLLGSSQDATTKEILARLAEKETLRPVIAINLQLVYNEPHTQSVSFRLWEGIENATREILGQYGYTFNSNPYERGTCTIE